MDILASIVAVSAIEFVGDSSFKRYARTNDAWALAIGAAAYTVMVGVLITVFRKTNTMFANGLWDGASAVIGTLLAFFLLKERMSTPMQYAGLGMIVAGIATMTCCGKPPY